MTGFELREIISKRGTSIAATAFSMGVTPMALQSTLKSPDVKSGIVEAAAKALGMTVAEMYSCQQEVIPEVKTIEPVETEKAPSSDNGDLNKVLLHLVAVIDDQTRKIDLLSQHVESLENRFNRKAQKKTNQVSFAFDMDTSESDDLTD